MLTAVGLLSLAAIVNLKIMKTARVSYRMAKDGVLPQWLARVSAGGTPRPSVAVLVAASLLFASTGSYESLVRLQAPWSIGLILILCLSAIKLRISEPDLARPWKMPFFPWLALVATMLQAGLIVLVVWDDPVAGFWSALVTVAPLPIWLLFAARWRREAAQIPDRAS